MTTTPEPKTPEQIAAAGIAEMNYGKADYGQADTETFAEEGAAAVAALRAAGLLVGAPTEEQIERAARAILREWQSRGSAAPDSPLRWEFKADARAALTGAGVAPQEPSKPRHFAPYGSTNAACDETVPRGALHQDAAKGVYADSRFTDKRSETTCEECRWRAGIMAGEVEPAPSPDREKLIAEKAEAWEEGVATALNHAKRGSDGIALKLVTFDGDAWPNPYRSDAALAAPPAVDEAKIAEVIEYYFDVPSDRLELIARDLREAFEKGALRGGGR